MKYERKCILQNTYMKNKNRVKKSKPSCDPTESFLAIGFLVNDSVSLLGDILNAFHWPEKCFLSFLTSFSSRFTISMHFYGGGIWKATVNDKRQRKEEDMPFIGLGNYFTLFLS